MKKFLKIIFFTFSALLVMSCGGNKVDVENEKLATGISPITQSADFGKPSSKEQIVETTQKISAYL